MAKRSKAEKAIQDMQGWSNKDLEQLQAMIGALLESRGDVETVEEKAADSSTASKRGGGHIELKMIPDSKSGKSYGPYRYLRYRQGGKLRSVYLGKAGGKDDGDAAGGGGGGAAAVEEPAPLSPDTLSEGKIITIKGQEFVVDAVGIRHARLESEGGDRWAYTFSTGELKQLSGRAA